jgi:hypothetical protein
LHFQNLYFAKKTKYTAKNIEYWVNPNTRKKKGPQRLSLRRKTRFPRTYKELRSEKEKNRGSQFTWSLKPAEDYPLREITRVCNLNLPYAMQTSFSENLINFDYLNEFNVIGKRQ